MYCFHNSHNVVKTLLLQRGSYEPPLAYSSNKTQIRSNDGVLFSFKTEAQDRILILTQSQNLTCQAPPPFFFFN